MFEIKIFASVCFIKNSGLKLCPYTSDITGICFKDVSSLKDRDSEEYDIVFPFIMSCLRYFLTAFWLQMLNLLYEKKKSLYDNSDQYYWTINKLPKLVVELCTILAKHLFIFWESSDVYFIQLTGFA